MQRFLATREDVVHHPIRASRLAGWVQSSWSAYLLRRRLKATIYTLQGLDDRTLSDIGLDRSEIESVVETRGRERRQRFIGISYRHQL